MSAHNSEGKSDHDGGDDVCGLHDASEQKLALETWSTDKPYSKREGIAFFSPYGPALNTSLLCTVMRRKARSVQSIQSIRFNDQGYR